MSELTAEQRAWVDALRSGKYEQGTFNLRNSDDQFCCLGIACELAIEAGVEVDVQEVEDNHFEYGGYGSGMPPEVQRWLGLGDSLGEVEDEPLWRGHTSLAYANDNGCSFAEIADIVEARIDDLRAGRS